MLAWIDLEMTGLDPQRDVILEIAALVTNDELSEIIAGPDLVIHQPPEALDQMSDEVRKMHSDNGLLEQVKASQVSLQQAGESVEAFLRIHIDEPNTAPLCGNTIGTDRGFLARYLPGIDEFLHYRMIDVSTVKELARRWNPDIYEQSPKKAEAHRALDDIKESIEELRWYRSAGFIGACAPITTPAAAT